MFYVHDFAGWFFPFGELHEFQKLLVTNRLQAENPRPMRDTAVSQFQVKFA